MDFGIRGKVALVCGGSKGMGRASADLLAAEGCWLAIVARGQADLDRAVDEIRSAGGTAIGIVADLGTAAGVAVAVDAVREAFGSPDIVVSQTNDFSAGRYLDAQPEEYERIFRTLTMGAIHLARATVPAMQKKRWGRFIHIGSGTAKEPDNSIPHILHNTIRPSTIGFLKSLADEVAADGVTVNTVAPGWIITEGAKAYLAAEGLDFEAVERDVKLSGGIPAGRAGRPHEIGGVVAFLASQYAAYVTGEWIVVDGGKHRAAF